jgi:hypothetical protein
MSHNGDGGTGHDSLPAHINLRPERCEQCGDVVVVKAMALRVNPLVRIKWNYRNTVECPVGDHVVVDVLQVTNNSRAGPG